MTTSFPGPSRNSRLFYVSDKSTGMRFLVDTGPEISPSPTLSGLRYGLPTKPLFQHLANYRSR